MSKLPYYAQHDAMDCGPTCLQMIAKYYGISININDLRNKSQYNKGGVSILGISQAAENLGFNSTAVQPTLIELINDAKLPCIIHHPLATKPFCSSLQGIKKQIHH